MRTLSLVILFYCLQGLTGTIAYSQEQPAPTIQGLIHVTDWPHSAQDPATTDSLVRASQVVPFIDSLAFGYSIDIDKSQPVLTYSIEWIPEGTVYIDGEDWALDELPGDLYIESIEIHAEVLVGGVPVTLMILEHPSPMIPPTPDFLANEQVAFTWETLLLDTDPETAKAYLRQGFKLANPRIAEIAFVYYDEVVAGDERVVRRPRRPARRTVYHPGISIWVDFPVYHRFPRTPIRRPAGDYGPRGDRVGGGDTEDDSGRSTSDRTATDRSAREGAEDDKESTGDKVDGILSGRKKKKDDDEDEGDLLPAVIAGAAVVAGAAILGGTVGYYGNTAHAPIGFMAGYVRPEGGFLLQVAVNEAALKRSKTEAEHLTGQLAGFYNAFESPLQPALGLGVLVTQLDNKVTYEMRVAPGLVGNFGHVVVYAGYEVVSGGVDVGLAYNFKAGRD